MSIEAMAYVLGIKVGGEGKRKLVLIGYANHAGRDGTNAWCSIKTVAEYAECSERTTQRHVKDLLEQGFMREGNQLAPIGTSTKPANQLPIVYDISMDEATRERWRAAYAPGRRDKFAKAGAEGGRRAAENRRRGDNVTPLPGQVRAHSANETSQVNWGDNVTPPENRGDSTAGAGVTESLFGGDTVAAPEPSGEPSTEPSVRAADLAAAPVTAQILVADWLDHCRKRPPDRIIGQVSHELKLLFDEEHDPADIKAGLIRWHRACKHPSTLASFVNEVMNGPQDLNGGRQRANGHVPYANPPDSSLYQQRLGSA